MGKMRLSDGIDLHYGGIQEGGAGLTDGSRNVTMVTGASSGKYAVMSNSVHGSYDFYNNGTSYFNGNVTVDANLTISGTSVVALGGNKLQFGSETTSYIQNVNKQSTDVWRFQDFKQASMQSYSDALFPN